MTGLPRDPLVDLLLPPLELDNPADAPAALEERRLAAAIRALPAPTQRHLGGRGRYERLGKIASSGDRDQMAWFFRAAPVGERPRIVTTYADALNLDAARGWADAGSHSDVAGPVLAVALWQASLAAGEASEDWQPDSVPRTYAAWAHEVLEEVAVEPGDPTPLVLGQMMIGEHDDRDAVLNAARRWQAVDPVNFDGNYWLIDQLRPSRFGAPGELERYLAGLVERAAPGSAALGLVPFGLCGCYTDAAFGDDPDPDPDAIFARHVDLLRRAYDRGPGHPDWRDPLDDGFLRNCFCFAFCYADAHREAWREFERLRGHWTSYPWQLKSGDALGSYLGARAWLFANLDARQRAAATAPRS